MFSVDFSGSVFPESYSFSFFSKKLPLEALEDPASTILSFEPFYQKGRLGPPESEPGLRFRLTFSDISEKRVEKQ